MNERKENILSSVSGSDDGVAGSGASMEASSTDTMQPSTSMDSGQGADNALWSEEPQGRNNSCLPFEVESDTAAAAAAEAVEDLPLPSSGLINEGCTCYMNSLLQLLFHLGYFRNAVYRMPENNDGGRRTIPQALKELFFHMQERATPGHTKELTSAFGWEEKELFVQHDIQEMATLLRDNLEDRMKGSAAEGSINQLFEGRGEQVVTTLDKAYVSRSRDTFYDIHLPLTPYVTLIDSLRSLTDKEQLVGDNKYRVEEPGKEPEYKDAEKSYEFRRFPPVIWFHLQRFDMNLMSPSLEMKKVNSRLEFPLELCLQEFEKGEDASEAGAKQDESRNKGNEQSTEQQQQQQHQQGPFSTDSPAIYDLQGVIVHRGSVRSGHYYCYIREWDPVHERFARWIEYDDDKVTVVSEDFAVSNNFGGCVARQGRPSSFMATNNAYILSYVRRADCAKVLDPPPRDSIPQSMWKALKRELLEEQHQQQVEDEQRRKVSLLIFTDNHIREYVEEFQRETFPREVRTDSTSGILLEAQKLDTVRSVYDRVAEHKQLRDLHLGPNDFRLWRFPATRWLRPSIPIKVSARHEDALMTAYLDKNEELKSSTTSISLYLQLPSTLPPLPVTDATPLICELQRQEGLNEIQCFMRLRHPTELDGVTLYLEYGSARDPRLFVYLELFELDGSSQEYNKGDCTNKQTEFRFEVNQAARPIRSLGYRIEMSKAPTNVRVREVRLSAPATAIPSLQPKYRPGEARLPELKDDNVLIFFKYFNYVTRRLTYAGSAMVPITATIKTCGNVLRQLLDAGSDAATRPIQMLEERHGKVYLLSNNARIGSSRIISGAVLVGQQEEPPLVCHYTRVEDYLSELSNTIHVRIVHVKFGKNPTPFALMLDSNGDSSSSSIAACGAGSSGSSGINATGRGGASVSSGDALTAGNEGGGGGAAEKCPVVELVLSTANEGKECADTAFYTSRRFEVIREYALPMDIRWSYAKVCEAVGGVSGYDPNYIRLYRADTGVAGQLSPEANPSLGTVTFADLVNGGRNPVFYFEVLPEPRRLVEAMPRVIATVRTEKNEPLYTEKLVLRQNTTFGALVQGMLERCALVLQRRRGADADAAAAASSRANDHTARSSANGAATESSGGATATFTIGSHYLILVLDVAAGAIKEIIEAPMTPEGRCNCQTLVVAERKPLTLSLVPAQPLLAEQCRLACCHGDWRHGMDRPQLCTFGQPFVVTVSDKITVAEAREVLLAYTGVSPSEVESSKTGVMMYTDEILYLPEWGLKLFQYWHCTRNNSGRIPTLLLNHERPREKPGSRYVAQNTPALWISRR
ncbi:putative ubiquitin hydrolase [Trypanosoma conorhini]|uniref:Putative ubiquitin hydrolase n=1 Tax=Trypanosoma conorhini TaxID=83891 RepID=A0A3R7MB36_9TRYP|nr:putative ubiquitin hydrolase [Trypanosoma conorhini]RNF02669.1 putative ubiquitin hydrolase [Trypanosoma conorhini]